MSIQPTDPPADGLHACVLEWYAGNARELPWRGVAATPWRVLVSELMLQQTPVARVLPVFETWLERWPTPAALAAEPAGEAVRAWGRLGYPRRALRLHACAVRIVEEYDGRVPGDYDRLRALPGIGDYTASAVASFAFGARHVVLDVNVRRVLARALTGIQHPAPAVTAAERRVAESVLPAEDIAATWAIAVMELGALVCTAQQPACERCPLSERCSWRAAGFPAYDGPERPVQTYEGTDRQCRGRLLAVLRDAPGAVPKARLDAVWPGALQRERALVSLLEDGLATEPAPGYFALP